VQQTAARRLPSPLALLRFRSGLTQEELAERAGIARESVSRLERGGMPQFTTAAALARALGVPVDAIFPRR
jgi:transcriptional regulator with XRE-family HTH domain